MWLFLPTSDAGLPILSARWIFQAKRLTYVWHSCMDLVDLLCWVHVRKSHLRALPNTKGILTFSKAKIVGHEAVMKSDSS